MSSRDGTLFPRFSQNGSEWSDKTTKPTLRPRNFIRDCTQRSTTVGHLEPGIGPLPSPIAVLKTRFVVQGWLISPLKPKTRPAGSGPFHPDIRACPPQVHRPPAVGLEP